jgi:hypothetical protein
VDGPQQPFVVGRAVLYDGAGAFVGSFDSKATSASDGDMTSIGLVVLSSNTIRDAETGAVLATLPPSGSSQWNWLGATDDGSLFATHRTSTDANSEVWYWGPGGSSAGPVTLPPATFARELSPDGRYLLAYDSRGPGESRRAIVMNLLGVEVAVLDGAEPLGFMTGGSIAVCIDPPGTAPSYVARWDIWSPPQRYGGADWPDACPRVVR